MANEFANRPACGYAFPGTYGHECGKPATLAGSHPSELTRSGIYWARRCAECAALTGPDNALIRKWEPLDPITHRNEWK